MGIRSESDTNVQFIEQSPRIPGTQHVQMRSQRNASPPCPNGSRQTTTDNNASSPEVRESDPRSTSNACTPQLPAPLGGVPPQQRVFAETVCDTNQNAGQQNQYAQYAKPNRRLFRFEIPPADRPFDGKEREWFADVSAYNTAMAAKTDDRQHPINDPNYNFSFPFSAPGQEMYRFRITFRMEVEGSQKLYPFAINGVKFDRHDLRYALHRATCRTANQFEAYKRANDDTERAGQILARWSRDLFSDRPDEGTLDRYIKSIPGSGEDATLNEDQWRQSMRLMHKAHAAMHMAYHSDKVRRLPPGEGETTIDSIILLRSITSQPVRPDCFLAFLKLVAQIPPAGLRDALDLAIHLAKTCHLKHILKFPSPILSPGRDDK